MPAGHVVEGGTGRPLAGVVVSDGLAVTRTGADGTFAFPDRADAEVAFVTVPSSHELLDTGWFARLGAGSDEALRFELTARPGGPAEGCTFVQVTDLHVSVDEGARLRPMIEAGVVAPPGIQVTGEVSAAELREDLELIVDRVRPDFIAATGDLADYGQREELEAYRDAITGLGVPVVSIPGNHDHLSVLSRAAIEAFFSTWRQEDTPELGPGEAFQRSVFGGDWRRPDSGRAPWRAVLGPLYFSFDRGGIHFVAYDGEGLRRYGDDYPQDAWLANDLAALAPGTPVVVLTHFPEPREFYRSRFGGMRLLASLSGHWHGARVWHDDEAHHWTSSTLGFGGIDFTARGYRIVDVDAGGARSRWETVEVPITSDARVTGAAALSNGTAVVALERPDVTGAVAAVGQWSHDLGSAARDGVTLVDGMAYVSSLTGAVAALDAATGALLWSHDIGDASERWTLARPLVADGRVLVGSARGVRAFDARDGHEVWHADLAPVDWAASWSGVAANDDTVVIGAANDDLHLAALDLDTGDVRWRHAGRDIAGISTTPVITGDQVLAARAPGWLAAYALADGALRWEAALEDAWPVALAVHGDVALVRSATGTVSAHDLADGTPRWARALGPGARAARPYSRAPGGQRAPLVVAGGQVWTTDGVTLVGLDLIDGAIATRMDGGTELVAIAVDDGHVVGVTVDGSVVGPA